MVWLLVGILALLGATALGGGIEMVLYPQGNQFVESEWLDEIPLVDSFALPGLVLGLVFGVGSLLGAIGVLRRRVWAPAASMLLGVGLALWIGLEVLLLPEPSVLEAIYAGVAVALIALPLTPAVRRYVAVAP